MLKSMLQHLRDTRAEELEGEGAGEAGFTLIELMVVLLIIAILLAIAIPTFLGVSKSANDRAAQSNLTNAVTESAAIFQNAGQAYPLGTTTTNYSASAPEFSWVDGSAATGLSLGQSSISVDAFAVAGEASTAYQGVALAVLSSKTSTCWYVVNLQATPTLSGYPNAGTFYAKGTAANCWGGFAVSSAARAATGASYSAANSIS
jgi:type IV pilus assembly protein PilA